MTLGAWDAGTPAAARDWLRGADVPWWIAGGWALDLFVGRPTRGHGDLDVGCFRADLPDVRAALAGWELHVAREGRLRLLGPGAAPEAHEHALWCRPAGAGAWQLEILLEERTGGDWVFRRDPSVRRAARELVSTAADGTAFLRPEVQLLYKAKGVRPRDEADLAAVLPGLEGEARAWLRAALARVHPGHPWIAALSRPR